MATQFSELNLAPQPKGLIGDKIKIERVLSREISVERFLIKKSQFKNDRGEYGDCLYMQFTMNGNRHVSFSDSKLTAVIQQIPENKFPFITTIVKQEDGSYQFT